MTPGDGTNRLKTVFTKSSAAPHIRESQGSLVGVGHEETEDPTKEKDLVEVILFFLSSGVMEEEEECRGGRGVGEEVGGGEGESQGRRI